ncbi:MAG: hypothetical protein GF331_17385 [Chitinivibrionales bacterium]|nr:hypothetical protein [Chitinivibrionales bacterium]
MPNKRELDRAEVERRVCWISYKERRILQVDLSGLVGEEGIPCLDREAELMIQAGEKVLVLIDLTEAVANSAFMSHAKKLGKEVFMPNSERRAMIGVDGLRAVLVSTYSRFIGVGDIQKLFGTREQALEWLIS